jgi:hypothetical protein
VLKKLGEEGQSTIEFALTMILLLGFVMFYFQLSMIFAYGNFVHYATFMSARAYLSAGTSREDQRERARDVIVKTLKKNAGMSGTDKFPSIGYSKGYPGDMDIPGFQVDPPSGYIADDRKSSWRQGVRYTFQSKLFVLPLAGFGKGINKKIDPAQLNAGKATANRVVLTSESWLGREPSFQECQGEMGSWMYDNGC